MCTNNNSNNDNPNKNDESLKDMREQLKAEEAKLNKKESLEEITSDTSEAENTIEDVAGKKVSTFYVLKFDKPVFPESTFELTDNKYVNEFSRYFMMKSRPQLMQRLLAVYFPGNKNSNNKNCVGTEIILKKDTNKASQFYGKIILESLDRWFQIVDFNEETNVVQAVPYVDSIKLPVPVKNANFMKEFTEESEIVDVNEKTIEEDLKNA